MATDSHHRMFSHMFNRMFSAAGTEFPAVPLVCAQKAHAYWTFERVAIALGTGLSSPFPLAGVCTDTRRIVQGDLFVALKGEHYDAHDFLTEAKDRGAAAVVVSDALKAVGLGIPAYVVPDTLRALGQLGLAWRMAWGGTVVAVAGSNGKTSTKELLKAAFGRTLSVHATSGNFNNLVGVPLTLLAIPSHAQVAIVELGTNAPGEIEQLRNISAPDIAVLTSIGEEHLEGLGDLAGVLREESDVFDGAQLAVVASACPEAVQAASKRARVTVSAGLSDAQVTPDAWGLDDDGRPWLEIEGVRTVIPSLGAHQAANAMLAYATAKACGVSTQDALAGMSAMVAPKMRTEWMSIGRATIINDAYNANPPSVLAALGLLSQLTPSRQRVAFLGTMRELGYQSSVQHDEVARAALATPVDLIVAIGEFASSFRRIAEYEGATSLERVVCVDDVEEAWNLAQPRIKQDAIILLKASRGLRLERLLPQLTTWAQS